MLSRDPLYFLGEMSSQWFSPVESKGFKPCAVFPLCLCDVRGMDRAFVFVKGRESSGNEGCSDA